MPDRRALIVGSWLAKGRDQPSHQRIRGLLDRWDRLFVLDRYKYRSLSDPAVLPKPMSNPRRADIVEHLDTARGITRDTEVLVYFVGHSVSLGSDDLGLVLGVDENGVDRVLALSKLLRDLQDAGIRRNICILDTCHAGRTRTSFAGLRDQAFAMFATGDAYAFNANFSDALLKTLEQPIRKNDQRIDRRAGGVTYEKVFQDARRRLLQARGIDGEQDPLCFGDLGNVVVEEAPRNISDEYNKFASDRTIYGRVHALLKILQAGSRTVEELVLVTQTMPSFLLREDTSGNRVYVSSTRISEYADFLRIAGMVVSPEKRMSLTDDGHRACDRLHFNRSLLDAIERQVLPVGLNLTMLDTIVQELLDNMIPPTPVRIRDRAAMLGQTLILTTEVRVALSLLPTTGRYLKGSADAIFPAELGRD